MKYSLYLTAFATGAAVLELLGTRMLFRLCECRLATDRTAAGTAVKGDTI